VAARTGGHVSALDNGDAMAETSSNSGSFAPTRQIVFAFLLSKVASIIAGSVLVAWHERFEAFIRVLTHVLSTVSFVLLAMLATGLSLPRLIQETRVRNAILSNHGFLTSLAVAIAIGLLMRFGYGGFVLGVLRVFDPGRADQELAELVVSQADPTSGLTGILIFGAVVGAVDEEIVYRRILQWHFCRRYGVLIGVLVTSAFFAVPHANPAVMISGICLSLLYLSTGMLWVPIVAHMTSNLSYPALASLHASFGPGVYEAASMVAALVLCVATPIAFGAIRRRAFASYVTPGSAHVEQADSPK
jgi:membrane protease YdiL (CAAX protease family)